MLALCLLTRTQSYACLLFAYLLDDCLCWYTGFLGIRRPMTSLGMVSKAMEVDIAPDLGRREGNSSHGFSRAKESEFSASADFYACLLCLLTYYNPMLRLLCFAYLLESNDCLRWYTGLLGIRLPKTSLGMDIEAWCLQCAHL